MYLIERTTTDNKSKKFWEELKVKVNVRVTLRLGVYRQSVRLGVKPLETHDQRFFFN
jgi:hypothetical protein